MGGFEREPQCGPALRVFILVMLVLFMRLVLIDATSNTPAAFSGSDGCS